MAIPFVEEDHLERNLQIVTYLHGRSNDQVLLAIRLLRLADYVEFLLVIEKDPLTLQALNVDFKDGGLRDVGSVLDQDLEEHLLWLVLQELVVTPPENGPGLYLL